MKDNCLNSKLYDKAIYIKLRDIHVKEFPDIDVKKKETKMK